MADYFSTSNYIMNSFTALTSTVLVLAIILAILVYIYTAWALMDIARRTKTNLPWLAWIPIANLYLRTKIAKVPWWTLLVILLAWIPFVGGLLLLLVMIWWWWKIAEARKHPGWWGILMIVPILNWILMGILAWGKK